MTVRLSPLLLRTKASCDASTQMVK